MFIKINYLFYRFLIFGSKLIFGPTLKKIQGLENLPTEQGFIIAANHASSLDQFVIVAAFYKHLKENFTKKGKKIYFIGELAVKERLYSSFMNEKCGYLPSSKKGIDHAAKLLKQGNIIGIFPEGIRNNTDRMSRGRRGIAFMAFPSGAPVIPTACFALPSFGFKQGLKSFFGPKEIIFGEPIKFFPKEKNELVKNSSLTRLTTDMIMLEIAKLCNKKYEF